MGITVGTRCLCDAQGHWQQATIRRVNEDGTFNLVHDEEALPNIVMPWVGVTRAEISVDDQGRWPGLFRQL